MPGTQPAPVQVSVGLFFANQPPSRTAYMLRLGRQDIDIAPGDRDYVNRDAYRLPVDIERLPSSRMPTISHNASVRGQRGRWHNRAAHLDH